MSQIKKLTSEQIARFGEFRSKWLTYGLSTDPADRLSAEHGVRELYRRAGLKEPSVFVWLRSPFEGTIGAVFLAGIPQVWAQVWDLVGDQVWTQVRAQVRDLVGAQVRDQVRAQVGDQVRAQVRDQVGAQKICFGQHDAEWLSFYDYFRIVCGIAVIDNLSGHFNIAQCCGWWWPYQGVVLLTERPIALHRDRMGRLHNANSLAIEYGDGWGVYAIHGVRVPGKYIETHSSKIDPAEVLKESNAQIRMAVISKIGFAQMLGKLPHKIISRAVNPRLRERNNELIEFALGNGMQVRGLHLFWKENSGEEKETVIPVWRTKEQFGEDTPDDINDCEAVRRWVMGLPKEAVIVEEI